MKTFKNISYDNQIDSKNTLIPKDPGSSLIVAQRGSGKTTLIINLLNYYKNEFNNIIIISPTILFDQKWQTIFNTPFLKENKLITKITNKGNEEYYTTEEESFNPFIKNIYTEYDDSILQELIDEQDSIQELVGLNNYKKYSNKNLIILDDIIGDTKFKRSQISGLFKKFYINIRHYNTSVIISSQMYKSVGPLIRSNLNSLILLGTANMAELKKIYEEFSNGLDFENWKYIYDFITNQPYHFLTFNLQNSKENRMTDSFEKYIKLN